MLIRNASLLCGGRVDVRIAGGGVAEIGARLDAGDDGHIVDADGGLLLPGLHDHHLHLCGLAAALDSLPCGPPAVADADALAATLAEHDRRGGGWLRGIGYDESVAGDIDRDWLDRHCPKRPLRIQHRSGQQWILNSSAIDALDAEHDPRSPLERIAGRASGRLFRDDGWLRARLGGHFPDLSRASALLAQHGITAVTDASHDNDAAQAAHFRAAQASGALRQSLTLMGDASLDDFPQHGDCRRGARKFHLNETRLPDFEQFTDEIRRSHAHGRPVAAHCVTRTELVFFLAALDAAGAIDGDRVEHASVAPPDAVDTIARLGLRVVTQPQFISERGDRYLLRVDADDQPWLYRLRAFIERGIPLAAGSDAPYGGCDPWAAMRAAVLRRTAAGRELGGGESLSPLQALSLYRGDGSGDDAGGVAVGTTDLCLLHQDRTAIDKDFAGISVRLTLRGDQAIHISDAATPALKISVPRRLI